MSQYLIIYTGGTISMEGGNDGGTVNEKTFQKKLNNYLQSKDISANTISITQALDSSQITYREINEIVSLLKTNYSSYDGFLVLHGTEKPCLLLIAILNGLSGALKSLLY